MEELSERCVLLKGLPLDSTESQLTHCLDFARGDWKSPSKREAIQCQDDSYERRWIVLFTTAGDAKECLRAGPWLVNDDRCPMTITPDYCAECIIPNEWCHQNEMKNKTSASDWCFPDKNMFTDTSSQASMLIDNGGLTVPFPPADSDMSLMSSGFELVDSPETLFGSKMQDNNSKAQVNTVTGSQSAVGPGLGSSTSDDTSFTFGSGGKHSNTQMQDSSWLLSGYSSVSSSEMFGSGRSPSNKNAAEILSEELAKCSIKSQDMFGSGFKMQRPTDSASVCSDKSEISSSELFDDRAQSPPGNGPISDKTPDVKHAEVTNTQPSKPAYTGVPSHAVPVPDAYPPMGWGPPGTYYPYPGAHVNPNQYYHMPPLHMPQYPAQLPAGYFYSYDSYGYPVPVVDPNFQSYPAPAGSSQHMTKDGGVDRPPIPLPRDIRPQSPELALPRNRSADPMVPNLSVKPPTRPADGNTTNTAKSPTRPITTNMTTGNSQKAAPSRPDKQDINRSADPRGQATSSEDELALSTLSMDRHGYLKVLASDALPATSIGDIPPIPQKKRLEKPSAGTDAIQEDSAYMKILDVDVASQIRFPESSWRPPLPMRPVTEPIIGYRPSAASSDNLHYRKTEIIREKHTNVVDVKGSENGKEMETCKIKVHGISEETNKETLELFFENKRSSGGDEIVKTEFSPSSGEAIIEFQSSAVVKRVLAKHEKSPLRLSGELQVRPYIPPPIDKYKLFISGIADATTQESLQNYLEARCKIEATDVVHGETPGTALVTFSTQPDIERVRMECKRRPLEDSVLSVTAVNVSCCVKVTGYSTGISAESLLYYFENKRRSGGGPVETVDRETCDDGCLVHFLSAEDANRVSARNHTLSECPLSVRLHYKCLQPDPSLILKIPSPIRFDELNTYLVRFMKNCKPLQKTLEDVFASSYAKIIWPESKDDGLEIICTLEQGHKDGRPIAQKWQQTCRGILETCTSKLTINDQLYAAQEVWSDMKVRLNEICVDDPESGMLFVNQDDHGIVVVGKQEAVNKLSRQVAEIISNLEQQLANEKQNITKLKTLKVYELTLINCCRFVDDVNKKGLDAKVNQEKREITFQGTKKDVDEAMIKMHKFLQSFDRSSVSLPKPVKDLLFVKKTREYVRKEMKKSRVIGVWDVVPGNDMVMYSRTKKDVETAIAILKRCLRYKTIPLDFNMEELLSGEAGKTHIDNMRSNYDGYIKVEQKPGELFIVSTDFHFNAVTDECMKFFDIHAVISKFIHVDVGKLRFIDSYFRRDLSEIEEQYKRLAVKITEVDKRTRQGFKIEGKKDGCRLAISRVQTVVEKIICGEYIAKSSTAKDFFCSPQGMDELKNIEMSEKCVLLVDSADPRHGSSSLDSCVPQERAACVMKGCKIVVMEGDMTEMKVDVIVNPSRRNLQHTQGLAGAINDKGGYNIQKECEAFVTNKGPLADAELFVSGPGSLPCQHVMHAVIPTWRDGTHNEDRRLKMTIKHCIEEAEKRGCSTIAFPAVGARNFRYPLEIVTQSVVESVVTHLRMATSESCLKGIFLCDIRPATVNQLITAMKRKVGTEKVQELASVGQTVYSGNEANTDSGSGGSYDEVSRNRHSSETSLGDRGIQISVVKGELARQNVDILVNSTNQKLDLRVGVISKSLVSVGGQAFMQECADKYPHGIRVGQVAVTTGGNLPCNNVYHGMLDKWDGGQGHAEKVMGTFVDRCLATADEQQQTSVAFPALGTGVLGFPADIVAKLMFSTIRAYSSAHPKSGIKHVLLVVYHGDAATVKAFQMIEQVQFRKKSSKRPSSPVTLRNSHSAEDMVLPPSTGRGHTFSIGRLTVKVSQGDITKETTNAIVNSTQADLVLSKGAVSKAILMAAGQDVQTECHTPENRAKMIRDEFIVTKAGFLLCQKIIHMKAKSGAAGWQKNVTKCLEEAEHLGLNSVAFPALGTGGKGCNPDSVAKAMFLAFRQFADSKKYHGCLKKIKIVIFQAEMVDKFVTAATGSPPKSWIPDIFKRNRADSHHDDKKLTIYIYNDSKYKVDAIRRTLDDMFVEERIFKPKSFLEELGRRQVDKILRMGKKSGVGVQFGSKVITLEGYSRMVHKVKDEISAYLNNIEKDADKAATVTMPPNWTKMTLTDPTKIVLLPSTVADYVAVSQKFVAETGVQLANIVKIERIQNPTLYTQYVGKKSQMEMANRGSVRPVEQMLWHGTAGTTVDNINQTGFNRNYNQGASHGIGVYFAVNANTSLGYCQPDATGYRHMYQANVLTGDFCQGQGNIRHPPCKSATNPNVTYDSTTDNISAPNFFVIFHDAQAYPLFHVMFK